jgi:N-acetylglucosaminyldiphosphoundecaprenol N-acetyl-beta-D-mannosaminyltransferase
MIHKSKHNVLGVLVDVVDYRAATEQVLLAARQRQPLALTALAVHGVMTGVQDPEHAGRLNAFDLVTPDGQPVRWALNLLHRAGLSDRVYGPTLTEHVLAGCAAEELPVYLYGSTEDTLARLEPALTETFAGLKIVGSEPSKFRDAESEEPREIAERIRASGARVVLVGLGCPRQEVFVYALRDLVDVPLLAVGAAFDYHSGGLRKPPTWMQRYGLEWLWRLGMEPRRLWRRYLVLNPVYLGRLGAQALRLWRPAPAPPATQIPTSIPI